MPENNIGILSNTLEEEEKKGTNLKKVRDPIYKICSQAVKTEEHCLVWFAANHLFHT